MNNYVPVIIPTTARCTYKGPPKCRYPTTDCNSGGCLVKFSPGGCVTDERFRMCNGGNAVDCLTGNEPWQRRKCQSGGEADRKGTWTGPMCKDMYDPITN